MSTKWFNFIWSLAILGAVSLSFVQIARHASSPPGLFGFFFLSWAVCLPISILIVLLRVLRIIGRSAFGYVFIGLSCFYLGNYGLFFGIGDIKRDALWVALYWVTVVIGIFILVDIFILEILEFPLKRVNK